MAAARYVAGIVRVYFKQDMWEVLEGYRADDAKLHRIGQTSLKSLLKAPSKPKPVSLAIGLCLQPGCSTFNEADSVLLTLQYLVVILIQMLSAFAHHHHHYHGKYLGR